MLGKLLKYDFRSMFKQFAFIWPAALALGLINRFTLNSQMREDGSVWIQDSAGVLASSAAMAAILAFVCVMVAMFVVVLIFVIQRFYRGLLGDEGYLMHTLPVQTWELIASKLICAIVVTIISIVVAMLAVLLLVPFTAQDLWDLFPGLMKALFRLLRPGDYLFILEFLLLMIAGGASSYLHIYLAMALGHLSSKHRVAMSVVAYVGINVAGTVLLNVLSSFRWLWNFDIQLDAIVGTRGAIHLSFWLLIAICLVVDAVYFFGTNYILKRNLNLE